MTSRIDFESNKLENITYARTSPKIHIGLSKVILKFLNNNRSNNLHTLCISI